jgi:signal transduction histidine kinase
MDDARAIIAEMIGTENALFVTRSGKAHAASLISEVGLLTSLLLSAVLGLAFNRDNQKQLLEAKAANDKLNEALALAEREAERRERLESQLRQVQKMEAIGQLTGGIAHDFNNMLAVILANLNLLKRQIARGENEVQRFIDGAAEGADRAAHLTQRLLAFARQQPLTPQPIDANKFVSGMSEILRRTLGQEIEVETILAGGLWRTHVDGHSTSTLPGSPRASSEETSRRPRVSLKAPNFSAFVANSCSISTSCIAVCALRITRAPRMDTA